MDICRAITLLSSIRYLIFARFAAIVLSSSWLGARENLRFCASCRSWFDLILHTFEVNGDKEYHVVLTLKYARGVLKSAPPFAPRVGGD